MFEREDRVAELIALLVGTASIAAAFWSFAGVGGALLAVAVAIGTAASTRYYGVALAHLVALVLTRDPTLSSVVLLEAGTFTYLVTELDFGARAREVELLAVVLAVLAGGILVAADGLGTLWSSVVLVGVTVGVGYSLHRFGALRIGLLTEDET